MTALMQFARTGATPAAASIRKFRPRLLDCVAQAPAIIARRATSSPERGCPVPPSTPHVDAAICRGSVPAVPTRCMRSTSRMPQHRGCIFAAGAFGPMSAHCAQPV